MRLLFAFLKVGERYEIFRQLLWQTSQEQLQSIPQRLRALTRMRIPQCFLLLSVYVAFGQSGTLNAQHSLASESVALVTKLYDQVIARHPVGIPQGEDLKVFAPYLSSSLLHRLDLYRACTSDWDRKNAGTDLKSPVGFFEHGIFSGADERSKPRTFHVEKTQQEDNGHQRVYVRLTSSITACPSVGSARCCPCVAGTGSFRR